MKIFKIIDQILADFGNIKALQRTYVDTYTENKIKNIEGDKIADLTIGYTLDACYAFNNK